MSRTERGRVRRRASSSTGTTHDSLSGYSGLIPLFELPTLAPTTITVLSIAPSSAAPSSTPSLITQNAALANTSSGLLITMAGFLSPVLISVWHYSSFLGVVLMAWLGYLLLPKGLRKNLCGAYPKRYRKSAGQQRPVGRWVYAQDTVGAVSAGDRFIAETMSRRNNDRTFLGSRFEETNTLRSRGTPIERQTSPQTSFDSPKPTNGRNSRNSFIRPGSSLDARSIMRGKDKYATGSTGTRMRSHEDAEVASSYTSLQSSHSDKVAPSPEHPSIERVPSNAILSETMKRLKLRGIRLIAHGVQCEPKRVWIKLEAETYSLAWQTEFPRKVPNQSGEVSIVLMRGSIHKIALPNVLYIDVGKRTSALLKEENRNAPDSCCFSFLTQNGSLDLQTSSRLERDALVSCFSMILDQVHNRNWRHMYEDGSSVVSSSTANHFGSDFVEI